MSYDILYGRQFIKVDDKRVIPFMLIGSNNCYDLNNKRARDWNNSYAHTDGRRIIIDNDTLLASIDKYREDTMNRCAQDVTQYNDESWAYDDKRWGYHVALAMYGKHTTGTTFGAYKSFYKTGIKEAMTIEELYEEGVRISIQLTSYYDKKEFEEHFVSVVPTVTFKTTQELIDTIAQYEAYYKGVKSATLWLSESGMDSYLERKRRLNRLVKQSKEKKRITVNEYYVLSAGNAYFIRNRKHGYEYCYSAVSAKAFMTEKAANTFHKRMRNKNCFEVVKIEDTRFFSI